jgi:hypothetical protein
LKLAAFAFSAALLGLAVVSPASAVTPSAAVGHATVQTDGITPVQYKKKHYKHRHKYRPGGRYKHAPKGWRRYSSRPSFWQTRGCVVVGPVWWCP